MATMCCCLYVLLLCFYFSPFYNSGIRAKGRTFYATKVVWLCMGQERLMQQIQVALRIVEIQQRGHIIVWMDISKVAIKYVVRCLIERGNNLHPLVQKTPPRLMRSFQQSAGVVRVSLGAQKIEPRRVGDEWNSEA